MDKPQLKEHDGMVCRACGNETRMRRAVRLRTCAA